MARIRRVDYFVAHVRNRAGEGARMLKALKKQGIGLLAFSAFPESGGAQVDFIPENSREFVAAARLLEWKISPRKIGFLVQGRDKTGALAGTLNKLGKAGINVIAMDALTTGKRFGAIFWVAPKDVARAVKLLGATS